MTPGRYLALRRTVAGVLKADVETAMGWRFGRAHEIETIDHGRDAATAEEVEQLSGFLALDPVVWRRLTQREPVRVCTGCGCSEMDACQDEDFGPCAWVGPAFCSDCQRKGVLPE